MVSKVLRPSGRPKVTIRYRQPPAVLDGNEQRFDALEAAPVATDTPAPWEGQWVKIEDLPDFRAKWGLATVDGDPDLRGQPWVPKLYLVEA